MKIKKTIFFSIVVPAYNASNVIEKTVDSLLNQSFRHYEIIVVNDGSEDNTKEILNKYKEKISIVDQKHQGPEVARNNGINIANGEYIVCFDSDDILYPYALEVYYRVINYFCKPPLLISKMKYSKSYDEFNFGTWNEDRIEFVASTNFFKKKISFGLSNSNIIVKRKILLKVGGYQLNSFIFDDRSLLFRIGTIGPMVNIQYPTTVGHLYHETNYSRNVKLFITGAINIINSEKSAFYPGGKRYKIDRRSLIGSNLISNIYYVIFKSEGINIPKKLLYSIKVILLARSMLIYGLLRRYIVKNYAQKNYFINAKKIF